MNQESTDLTSASRRIREGVTGRSPEQAAAGGDRSFGDPPTVTTEQEAAAVSSGPPMGATPRNAAIAAAVAPTSERIAQSAPLSDPEYVDLHELAKGWKAALGWCSDSRTRHESRRKNDRGNLPLHSAASFRAPVEVIEGLLEGYPEAASVTNNYGNLALHFTAWKKGPLDCMKLLLQVFPEGAAQRNNHGNLPLHYAAHYNAPIEVVEALYHAYPEAARQKNNDSNTPLDLAVADGASNNVVALLQGKSVPPNDEEIYEGARSRCERVEREMQRQMVSHDTVQEDLEVLLGFLMDVRECHPSAMYSSGIDPERCGDMESLMDQVRERGLFLGAGFGLGFGLELGLSFGLSSTRLELWLELDLAWLNLKFALTSKPSFFFPSNPISHFSLFNPLYYHHPPRPNHLSIRSAWPARRSKSPSRRTRSSRSRTRSCRRTIQSRRSSPRSSASTPSRTRYGGSGGPSRWTASGAWGPASPTGPATSSSPGVRDRARRTPRASSCRSCTRSAR